jgi:hypothetical protein
LEGFTFYRPSISISAQFTRDADGNVIGQKDSVSITDTVLFSDLSEGLNLLSVFDNAVSQSIDPSRKNISYPNNNDASCVIKSVSADGDSDFVNKLTYTVTVEALPIKEINSIYGKVLSGKNIASLSVSESLDVPYDMSKITTPLGDILYNKPITYVSSVQVACNGNSKLQHAADILAELTRTGPSADLAVDMSQYRNVVTSITKSSSAQGTMSIEYTTLLLPTDATANILANEEISKSKSTRDNFQEKSYKITFTALEGPLEYNGTTYNVTKYPNNLSILAYDKAQALMRHYIEAKDIPDTTLSLPGKDQSCTTPFPKLTVTGCWNAKTISLENNISNNSAALSMELTTQNIGNCDRNGYKIDYSISTSKRDQSRVYAEIGGWSSPGYIVQDFNTYKDEYYEYSIDIGSIKNCVDGSEMIDLAKSYFESIDLLSGGGIITSNVISVSANKCSLKITQYSGADLSVDTVGV